MNQGSFYSQKLHNYFKQEYACKGSFLVQIADLILDYISVLCAFKMSSCEILIKLAYKALVSITLKVIFFEGFSDKANL